MLEVIEQSEMAGRLTFDDPRGPAQIALRTTDSLTLEDSKLFFLEPSINSRRDTNFVMVAADTRVLSKTLGSYAFKCMV